MFHLSIMQFVESMQDFNLHTLSKELLCCLGGHGKLEFQHSLSLIPMLVTFCRRLHIVSHTPVLCLENEHVDFSFILHFTAKRVQFETIQMKSCFVYLILKSFHSSLMCVPIRCHNIINTLRLNTLG